MDVEISDKHLEFQGVGAGLWKCGSLEPRHSASPLEKRNTTGQMPLEVQLSLRLEGPCRIFRLWAWGCFFLFLFFSPQLDFTVETGCKNPETREQTAFYRDLNYILHLKNQPEQRVQWPGAVCLCQPPAAPSLATAGHTPKAPGAPCGRPGEGAKWKESI